MDEIRIYETYMEVLMERNVFLTATKLSTHVPCFLIHLYQFQKMGGKHYLTDILEVTNTHNTGTII